MIESRKFLMTEETAMRKIFLLGLCITLLLTGCGLFAPQVDTMKGWSFQYNESTEDYSLFFGLCDENENYISAQADVEIRILNSNDEIVYSGEKLITKEDFGYYTNQIEGERFLADVRIDAAEITEGSSAEGTVYFTVSGETYSFDEVKCDVYCLPTKGIQLELPDLPLEIQNKSAYFGVQSKVGITDIAYEEETGFVSALDVTLEGEVLYQDNSWGTGFYVIEYKLLDQEGYVVDSGSVLLDSALTVGDRFKEEFTLYDVVPGEMYTLQLFDYKTV